MVKRKTVFWLVLVSFVFNMILPYGVRAQVLPYMSEPGQMIYPGQVYELPRLVGMRFATDNPYEFTFVLNGGNVTREEKVIRAELAKIHKYFLAALTISEKDIWVNLSPYEQHRVTSAILAQTELGKDLLGEDYVLKQLASSLTYPDSETGKAFWQRVYQIAQEKLGTRNIPVGVFNKIWIVPGKIKVIECKTQAAIETATLKVMTQEDYLATQKSSLGVVDKTPSSASDKLSAQAMREVIIPVIEKEVNTGKHFSQLRQIYNTLIMAAWYKNKLKNTVLEQGYFNQNKINGADTADTKIREKIYNEYVKAFQTGVYNMIRTERDPGSAFKHLRRKYFSGGAPLGRTFEATRNNTVPGTEEQIAATEQQATDGNPVTEKDQLTAGSKSDDPYGSKTHAAGNEREPVGLVDRMQVTAQHLLYERVISMPTRMDGVTVASGSTVAVTPGVPPQGISHLEAIMERVFDAVIPEDQRPAGSVAPLESVVGSSRHISAPAYGKPVDLLVTAQGVPLSLPVQKAIEYWFSYRVNSSGGNVLRDRLEIDSAHNATRDAFLASCGDAERNMVARIITQLEAATKKIIYDEAMPADASERATAHDALMDEAKDMAITESRLAAALGVEPNRTQLQRVWEVRSNKFNHRDAAETLATGMPPLLRPDGFINAGQIGTLWPKVRNFLIKNGLANPAIFPAGHAQAGQINQDEVYVGADLPAVKGKVEQALKLAVLNEERDRVLHPDVEHKDAFTSDTFGWLFPILEAAQAKVVGYYDGKDGIVAAYQAEYNDYLAKKRAMYRDGMGMRTAPKDPTFDLATARRIVEEKATDLEGDSGDPYGSKTHPAGNEGSGGKKPGVGGMAMDGVSHQDLSVRDGGVALSAKKTLGDWRTITGLQVKTLDLHF